MSYTELLFDTNQSRVTLLSKILGSTKPVNLLLWLKGKVIAQTLRNELCSIWNESGNKKIQKWVCLMFNILGTTRTVKLMPWMQHYYTIKEKQKTAWNKNILTTNNYE